MDKKKWIAWSLALVLLIGGAAMLYNNLSGSFSPDQMTEDSGQGEVDGETGEKELQDAPDFTVLDQDGNPVKLSDFLGRPIVLNFWASWCGPCKSEMPDFEKVYNEQGESIEFLMVNVTGGRETLDSAKSFIAESGYTFPVYYDTELEAASLYGANSIPVTFFIDAEGKLVAYTRGSTTADVLMQGIGMITE